MNRVRTGQGRSQRWMQFKGIEPHWELSRDWKGVLSTQSGVGPDTSWGGRRSNLPSGSNDVMEWMSELMVWKAFMKNP